MAMDSNKANNNNFRWNNTCSAWAAYFNCRMMPHGGKIVFPITLVTLAWVASLTHDGCDYARLTGPGVEILTGSASIPFVHLGMEAFRIPGFYPATNSWRVAYSSQCEPYTHYNIIADRPWVTSEWLSFSSIVIGGTAMMFLWSGICLTLRPSYWKFVGVGSALASIVQMFSFVWFSTRLCHTTTRTFLDFQAGREVELAGSDASSCALFFASKCSIASICLYLSAALLILLGKYPTPVPKLIAQDDDESVAMLRQRYPRIRTRMNTKRPSNVLNNRPKDLAGLHSSSFA